MKLTVLEHTCLLIAAGGLGAKVIGSLVLLGLPVWLVALLGGGIVAGVSLVRRKAWQASV